jgi:acetyl esterase/lipase
VEELEYLRHGETPLLATVVKPVGEGPFPALVEIHGGGWVHGSRTDRMEVKRHFASQGFVVAAIDFRTADPYPASLGDVNYAIRYVKAHAEQLKTAPELVGVLGYSSGGHQAVLAALRPEDPRYLATPNPPGAPEVDASVRFVVAFWPVISPLGRYHFAQHKGRDGTHEGLLSISVPAHEHHFGSEETMAEADPVLALERGEQTAHPPLLCIQSRTDPAHPIEHLERFASLYREAGGEISLELEGIEDTPDMATTLVERPDSPLARRVYTLVEEFVKKSVS